MNSITRRFLREFRELIQMPWVTGAIGRRIRYLDDFLKKITVLIGLPCVPGAKGRWIQFLDDFSGN